MILLCVCVFWGGGVGGGGRKTRMTCYAMFQWVGGCRGGGAARRPE